MNSAYTRKILLCAHSGCFNCRYLVLDIADNPVENIIRFFPTVSILVSWLEWEGQCSVRFSKMILDVSLLGIQLRHLLWFFCSWFGHCPTGWPWGKPLHLSISYFSLLRWRWYQLRKGVGNLMRAAHSLWGTCFSRLVLNVFWQVGAFKVSQGVHPKLLIILGISGL